VSIGMKRLVCEPVFVHHLSAYKGFERQRGEHVEPEKETGNVHHQVVVREVVEHVAKRLVTKGEVARQCHNKARNQRDTSAVMRDAREAVNCGLAKGAVYEKTVVMTDEGKGYNAYSFEDAIVDKEGATQLPFELGGDAKSLGYDSHNNDTHADQCKSTGFGELWRVSSVVALGFRE
jgi:hypothetical protein